MSPALEFRLPLERSGFRILRLLGSGAMGAVYEAEEVASYRRVALKVLSSWLLDSTTARKRFEREARLAASISHPNVVFVYGVHEIEGSPAIAMELMSGSSLADPMHAQALPSHQRVIGWMLQVIDGLEAAHRGGVLHRDIKPANCFFAQDGRVKIGDFGLARAASGESTITAAGAFVGTPLYASPEQARGSTLDVRSDIYGVGATLYALLAGVPAFHGGDSGESLFRILNEEPEDPRKYRSELPAELAAVVLRAMAKKPDDRFADYAALKLALTPFASDTGSTSGGALGLQPNLQRPAGGAVDRFQVVAVIGTSPRGRLLLARDPQLERDVWIHLFSPLSVHESTAPSSTRSSSPTWLRLIHSERSGAGYDVYEALGGASLRKVLQQGVLASWINAHPVLLELATFLHGEPASLHVEQLWIDQSGQLRVLDFALASSPEPRLEPLELLARVARDLTPSASRIGAIEGIPTAAKDLLARLLDPQRARELTLARVIDELRAPEARPGGSGSAWRAFRSLRDAVDSAFRRPRS